ncbi:30S ribosomal protein S2 [Limihaloglobus sulfuriphilus]|uniref:Small ribosomal subunit protein uS2 n=1 Tax=Limihaloglobus sulfuriphilus TaxID=1851148 RepID=A0A1Q2MD81_9BACT|nr:30S ribosomal protein S2 [Limihaloglobus sulfuriphilus]AQQ70656.1 30S ribosomal protein S2 [Limihaloglobus sulfuriphilus]
MNKELARDLINSGVHFGHRASRWNPKMAPYIFAKRGMVHIVDVKQTIKGLLISKKLLAQVVASGKDVVFVGTKRQAQKAVKRVALESGMHYANNRWLGGTLTNFRTIRSRVKRMEELEAMEADGSIAAESKKRASTLKRELTKIKVNLDGVRKMNRIPGAMVVVDTKNEKNALAEAKKLGVFTIGIIDTDSDPDAVNVAIPGNDDSVKAIEIIMTELGEAIAEGKTLARIQATASDSPIKGRSKRRAMGSAKDSTEDETPLDADDSAGDQGEKSVSESTVQADNKEKEPAAAPAESENAAQAAKTEETASVQTEQTEAAPQNQAAPAETETEPEKKEQA